MLAINHLQSPAWTPAHRNSDSIDHKSKKVHDIRQTKETEIPQIVYGNQLSLRHLPLLRVTPYKGRSFSPLLPSLFYGL